MKRKVEIEVDVPEGREPTGEFRAATIGEFYLAWPGKSACWGMYCPSPSEVLILRNVEPKRESRWVNLYGPHVDGYKSRADADYAASADRQAVIRLDFEDGKFVGCESEQLEPPPRALEEV